MVPPWCRWSSPCSQTDGSILSLFTCSGALLHPRFPTLTVVPDYTSHNPRVIPIEATTLGKMGLVASGNDADGTCRKATIPNCPHLPAPRVLSVAHRRRYGGHKARTVFARECFVPAQVFSDASEPTPLSRRSTHQIQSLQDQRINSVGRDQNEP